MKSLYGAVVIVKGTARSCHSKGMPLKQRNLGNVGEGVHNNRRNHLPYGLLGIVVPSCAPKVMSSSFAHLAKWMKSKIWAATCPNARTAMTSPQHKDFWDGIKGKRNLSLLNTLFCVTRWACQPKKMASARPIAHIDATNLVEVLTININTTTVACWGSLSTSAAGKASNLAAVAALESLTLMAMIVATMELIN